MKTVSKKITDMQKWVMSNHLESLSNLIKEQNGDLIIMTMGDNQSVCVSSTIEELKTLNTPEARKMISYTKKNMGKGKMVVIFDEDTHMSTYTISNPFA